MYSILETIHALETQVDVLDKERSHLSSRISHIYKEADQAIKAKHDEVQWYAEVLFQTQKEHENQLSNINSQMNQLESTYYNAHQESSLIQFNLTKDAEALKHHVSHIENENSRLNQEFIGLKDDHTKLQTEFDSLKGKFSLLRSNIAASKLKSDQEVADSKVEPSSR